jgi:hypothetical protein
MLIQEEDIPIVNNITLNRWENKRCRCLNAFLISGASISLNAKVQKHIGLLQGVEICSGIV